MSLLLLLQEASSPAGFGARAFHNQTTLHPLGLVIILAAATATLVVRRSYATFPLLFVAALVPLAQRVVIAGLDFNFIRVLVVVGALRVLSRGEQSSLRPMLLDKVIVAWVLVGTAAYVLLRGGAFGALVYRAGLAVEALGVYFLVRVWVRDWSDFDRVAGFLGLLALISAGFFLFESSTRSNLFETLGVQGVPTEREGRLRCQGPFTHPILAGCFWASVLPIIAVRWWTSRRTRMVTAAAVLASIVIVFTTASSTPLMGVATLPMAASFFVLRRRMRSIRRLSLAGLVLLHFSMNAPVWHLITRIDVVGGSTGFHRYRLIDATIKRFSEWALLGTRGTGHWGFHLFDVTNQWVKEAISGGIVGLLLFCTSIVLAYKLLGGVLRRDGYDRRMQRATWAVGMSIFAQCVMFLGISISHSVPNVFVWLLPIALAGSLWTSRTISLVVGVWMWICVFPSRLHPFEKKHIFCILL